MENIKLSQEQLDQITDFQNRMQAVQSELGQIELLKMDLSTRRTGVETYLTETRTVEADLVKGLEDAYGKGSVNLEKGEFIPDIPSS